MTIEQKYAKVLEGLGELLADKDLTIHCKDYRIKELEKKLAAAEEERDEAQKQLEKERKEREA